MLAVVNMVMKIVVKEVGEIPCLDAHVLLCKTDLSCVVVANGSTALNIAS
jgi:hypothetical protein